jgi:Tfp pilus assembly protein PilN
VGLGLRRSLSCPVEINLLPPVLVARRVFRRRLPFLGLTAIGLILTMLVFWMFLHRMRSMAEERLSMVQSRVQALETPNTALSGLASEKEVVYGKVNGLTALIGQRTRWLTMINDLHAHLIEGMWLTSVRPLTEEGKPGTRLVIEGMGFGDKVSHQAVTDFAMSLKGTGFFTDDVQIKKIKPVSGTDYVNEFTINVMLRDKLAAPLAKPATAAPNKPAEE